MISIFHQKQRLLFKEHGLATPDLDSRLLICHACALSHEHFILQPDRAISAEEGLMLEDFQKRRLKGEPVSRIIGVREFWGRDFLLGSETLDPRPDTESLIEAVLEHSFLKENPPKRILDLGTGTGAILLTLLKQWPEAKGLGVDKSSQAIEVACENAKRLGCEERAQWQVGHWFDKVMGSFDLIISNPPYIISDDITSLAVEVADYDPILALDGGKTGLQAYQDIIKDIYDYLAERGVIAFELGKGQYNDVQSLLMASTGGFSEGNFMGYKDLSGVKRCILVQNLAKISKTKK